jgi:hypothetical protein
MKTRLTYWIFSLSMLFALCAMSTPANAQVVVKVGTHHPPPRHHHRHHHRPYRR